MSGKMQHGYLLLWLQKKPSSSLMAFQSVNAALLWTPPEHGVFVMIHGPQFIEFGIDIILDLGLLPDRPLGG